MDYSYYMNLACPTRAISLVSHSVLLHLDSLCGGIIHAEPILHGKIESLRLSLFLICKNEDIYCLSDNVSSAGTAAMKF